MREILFRAKAKHNNEWVCGFYLSNQERDVTRHYIKQKTDGILSMVEVLPETVGQYTGLTDKNETTMFEGDILQTNGIYGYEKAVMGFDKGCFKPYSQYYGYIEVSPYECEVIGNTHDNPELLEV